MMNGIIAGVVLALPLMGMAEGEAPEVTWKSSVSLGATYKAGNTDKTLYTVDFKADRFAPENDWINSLHGEQGKTEGEQTEGQLRAQSDYRHKFAGKNLYGGVFSEGYHDAIKEINARIKVGPNLGYYFINKDKMKLDTSVGLNEVYERTQNDERTFGEWRAAANFLWDISDTASYYLNMEYSADLENEQDGNGLLVTGVKSKLNAKLSLFVELREEYDNIPDTATTQHTDTTVIAGLSYSIL
ncbi:MAG: DUF481 domain-containing protein [Pontiellaceae bacterium]|nr:DUF481 domain-containing protein [Pontiellaceae bacterium]